MSPRRIHAFSLIELSIVLVILGLLVGGILAGQSLIRASELRAVGAEYTQYTTAIAAFRDKYFALPGDMTNAQSFWGSAANCPGTHLQGSTTSATCNGNGDGRIIAAGSSNEYFRFWQHLSNAGLVEGQFSGVTGGPNNNYTAAIGSNMPRSKMANGGWEAFWYDTATVSTPSWLFEGTYGNLFMFGATATDFSTDRVILRSDEAWNLDTKIDEGKPGLGRMRVYETNGNCHDTPTSTSNPIAGVANYDLTKSNLGATCAMLFQF